MRPEEAGEHCPGPGWRSRRRSRAANIVWMRNCLVAHGRGQDDRQDAPVPLLALAQTYAGQGCPCPTVPDPPAGFVTHLTVTRVGGRGDWSDNKAFKVKSRVGARLAYSFWVPTDDNEPPATGTSPSCRQPGTELAGISAADLACCLRVLARADGLPAEHPDAVAIRRATARVFKGVKEKRRAERRDKVRTNDRAVTALTATGAPERIDDETQGLQLVSNATGALAGRLLQPRSCYTCKARYVDVDPLW